MRDRSSWRLAARISLAYLIVATAWILGSDSLVSALPDALAGRLQTWKGLLFVAVTASVLHVLMLRGTRELREAAERAAAARRTLSQVVDTVPAGVLLVDRERRITFMNPAAESLLGVRADDARGHSLEAVGLVAADEETSPDLLFSMVGDSLRVVPAPGGSARAVVAQSARVDPANPQSGWVIAVADVTDETQARDRSARLVRGYRYLSHAAVAMTRVGNKRALLEEVARLAVEQGGYAGAWVLYQEMSGTPNGDTAFFGQRGRDCPEAEHVGQAYSPDSELLERLVGGEVLVSNDLARDPRSPWYTCAQSEAWGSCASIALDAPGRRSVVLVLFANDPGYFDAGQIELLESIRSSLAFALNRLALDRQRLDAEEAMERSERSYRTMFQVHPQPMWVYDIETLAFLAVNDAAVAKYGYSREEFAAMTIADIRPKTEVPRLLRNVLNVSDGLDDAGIWTHIDHHGRQFPVHIYSHLLDWEGRRAELVMIMEVARVE